MIELIYGVIASLISSAISAIFIIFGDFIKKKLKYILPFTAGVFIGSFFLNALPHLIEDFNNKELLFILLLFSFTIFYIIESFMHFHHHGEKGHHHNMGILNLIGDFFHNFVDGLLIISSFKISIELGIIITIAIILHEIPQEFGDFSILLYSGYEKIEALLLNLLVSLSSLLGVIIGYFLPLEGHYIMALVAGSFLYIGASDLIPLTHKESKKIKEKIIIILLFVLGIILMKAVHYLIDFLIK